jgi:hypothetical protein
MIGRWALKRDNIGCDGVVRNEKVFEALVPRLNTAGTKGITVAFTPEKIEWSEKIEWLQRRYEQAVKNDEEVFEFEGNEYLTVYAKYLLHHLRTFEYPTQSKQ